MKIINAQFSHHLHHEKSLPDNVNDEVIMNPQDAASGDEGDPDSPDDVMNVPNSPLHDN